MVTPTYYVYFTSTTIITSAVLFQGFKGTASSIVTVVMGFLTICSGVVLLQLSKSAKDVPDAAVFSGDLNQVRTIAEQEQAETEPKADAIRGAAALVRRFSTTREKMEMEEYKRMRAEKEQERLEAVNEDGQTQFEWDGLRRRRTSKPTTHHKIGILLLSLLLCRRAQVDPVYLQGHGILASRLRFRAWLLDIVSSTPG